MKTMQNVMHVPMAPSLHLRQTVMSTASGLQVSNPACRLISRKTEHTMYQGCNCSETET